MAADTSKNSLRINSKIRIEEAVSKALLHLKNPSKPALTLYTASTNDSISSSSATALHKLISVCEIVKREYTQSFELEDRQAAKVGQSKDAASKSEGSSQRLPRKLLQYNRLQCQQYSTSPLIPLPRQSSKSKGKGAETVEEVGDDEDDANPMATDEAIQAHEEALTTLTEQGRKRPRKKHTPMMEIVLSPRRVNLTIDDGWTIQQSESILKKGNERRRKNRRRKAEAKLKEKEQSAKEAESTLLGDSGADIPPAQTVEHMSED